MCWSLGASSTMFVFFRVKLKLFGRSYAYFIKYKFPALAGE